MKKPEKIKDLDVLFCEIERILRFSKRIAFIWYQFEKTVKAVDETFNIIFIGLPFYLLISFTWTLNFLYLKIFITWLFSAVFILIIDKHFKQKKANEEFALRWKEKNRKAKEAEEKEFFGDAPPIYKLYFPLIEELFSKMKAQTATAADYRELRNIFGKCGVDRAELKSRFMGITGMDSWDEFVNAVSQADDKIKLEGTKLLQVLSMLHEYRLSIILGIRQTKTM